MTPGNAEIEAMVRSLHDRQAIQDVVHRFSRAIDRQDRSLLLSCFHADGLDDHGFFAGSGADFFDWTDPSHLHLFRTHHHIVTNHSCELAGDTAHAETYWQFAGMAQAGDHLASYGGRYIDRFERRAGNWRIATRKCLVEWWGPGMMDGNSAAIYARVGRVARDTSDCSYDRPLTIDPARIGQHGAF